MKPIPAHIMLSARHGTANNLSNLCFSDQALAPTRASGTQCLRALYAIGLSNLYG
jgi:hypothetical protein